MIRNRPLAVLLAATLSAALAASMSGSVGAQEALTGPEGSDWKLTSYLADSVVMPVPFGVSATLLLEGGLASGSGGCNPFSGSYLLEGTSLTFDDQLSTTLKLCAEDVQAVEAGYLTALPAVAGWTISEDVLQLSDALGEILLTFEVPDVGLTSSELAGLAATLAALRTEIAGLRTEITRLNVDRLRDRVKVLEAGAQELQGQVDALEETGSSAATGNGFSQAEGILLEGIPTRIASRCLPLRSSLPKGTVAAVRCTPDTSAVATLDYHLLEGEDAAAALTDTMDTFNVAEATSETTTCEFGIKSQRHWVGLGWQSEGCYRTNGRAEVRFVDNATDCRQLKAGDKRIKSPALYMALQGTAGDIAGVHDWATRNLDKTPSQITSISQPIERSGEKLSPSCPA